MLRSLPRIAAAALPRGNTAFVLARACPTLARPQLCHLAQRPRTFATDTPATAPASATSAAASKAPAASAPTPPRDPLAIIKHDISTHRVFVYMKGHPLAPSCGYSQQVVQILREEGVDFGSRNVMEEEDIRSAIKEFRCVFSCREHNALSSCQSCSTSIL
jgi:hypothetical protein